MLSTCTRRIAAFSCLVLLFLLSGFVCIVVAQQSVAPENVAASSAAPSLPAIDNNLRTALEQTGAALRQVDITRWKLSREWKAECAGDVNSIQQDLAGHLPALFLAASQSSTALAPQLDLMHNIDALYDVLVRVSTAANLAGGKQDAALLDKALQQLESARKTAATELLAMAGQHDQQLASMAAGRGLPAAETSGAKTIVVDNRVGHHSSRHKSVHPRAEPAPAHPSTP